MRRIREVLRLRALFGENLSAIASGSGWPARRFGPIFSGPTAPGWTERPLEDWTDEARDAALYPPPVASDAKRPLAD